MDSLSKWDLEHWWKLLAAAGALLAIASAPVQFRPGLFVGLGLLFVGIGEWINHPLQTSVTPGWKLTGYPRSNTLFGLTLDLFGIVLFVIGLYRLF